MSDSAHDQPKQGATADPYHRSAVRERDSSRHGRHDRLPRQIGRGTRGLSALSLVLLVVFALTGCGYTTSELYPTQYNSVSVPNFANRSGERNVEFALHEALVKEIEHRTPYKVVSGSGLADTQLTGTVTSVDRRLVSRDATAGLPQEIEITVTVNYEWRDLRTGKTLRGVRGFSSAGQFVPNRTVGEFDEDGRRLAIQRLAQDIVSQMRDDGW
jgi:hypothetical protein